MPVEQHLTLVRGDTLAIPLAFSDPSDNSPLDMAGYTVRFTCKTSKFEDDSQAVISKDIVLPAGDTYTLIINPEDTNSLNAPQSYDYDIQLETPTGEVFTAFEGKLKLEMGATWR